MKPILFEKDAKNFITPGKNETESVKLGIARLPDAESCTVTEERNGAYELEMVYPVSGRYFSEITLDRILVVTPYDGGNKQAFRIYASEATIDGRVKFYARHISYQLNFIPINPISGTSESAQELLSTLGYDTMLISPFRFNSDIEGTRSYNIKAPVSLRTAIGGMDGSALDLYHGELEWDNWTVKLHSARGADNGVRITYGKNLSDLKQNLDIGSTITGVAAFWQGQSGDGSTTTVYSSPRIIKINNSYAHERIVVLDTSSQFMSQPTGEQIAAYATSWLSNTAQTDPSAGLEVNFVPLWQTEEYKQYAPLERVKLCDTVYVSYRQLGITVKKKVTKTVWNVLLDRYDSIELGGTATISDTIASIGSAASAVQSDVSKMRALEYVEDQSARDFTLSGNYAVVTPDVEIPAGKKIVAVAVVAWSSNTGAFSVIPYGAGRYAYLVGNSGTVINGLKLRYWYI